MVIFPLAPDQTIAQMWSSGAQGEVMLCKWLTYVFTYHITRNISHLLS